MDRQQIQEIILRVLAEYGEQGPDREVPLDFPVEVSARHVHLTGEAVERLFGTGAKLIPKRPLSQPGQFLSEERVTLVTPGGRIENVAVLGPERDAVQTELSVTDCRTLGLRAPICMSGDLEGASDVYIIGPKGMIEARESVIVARAHVHITPPEAERFGITDGQRVSVTLRGEREVTLQHVICRVSSQAALAMHIDYDEANACMLPKNATARMRVKIAAAGTPEKRSPSESELLRSPSESGLLRSPSESGLLRSPSESELLRSPSESELLRSPSESELLRSPSASRSAVPSVSEGRTGCGEAAADGEPFKGNLITEAVARRLAAGRKAPLTVARGVILTPSARDVLNHAGIAVLRQTEVPRQTRISCQTGGGRI